MGLEKEAKKVILATGLNATQKTAMVWLLNNGGFYVDGNEMIYLEKDKDNPKKMPIAQIINETPNLYNLEGTRTQKDSYSTYDRIMWIRQTFIKD